MAKLIKTLGYELDTPCITPHYQPAVLVELALSRDVSEYHLLKGTRLQIGDFELAEERISPDQYLTLIKNCQKLTDADDISFLYGQRLFPGFYGAVSQALQQANNLRQAITILCEYHAILSPLFTPRYYENDDELFLYWVDSTGSIEQHRFIIESYMSAFVSMVAWLAGEKMPWQFEFSYDEPEYVEQYWVNFGQDIRFNQQMNRIRLPRYCLDTPWPNASKFGMQGALKESDKQLSEEYSPYSFLDQIYSYLQSHIDEPLNLDKVSFSFGLSPASMKRKLKKHQTSFQQQLDLVRKHTAIYLYEVKQMNSQEIAEYLCFNDMNNFRRAFKRWTGSSPYHLFAQ